jgi:hypothetical protein
VSSVSLAVALVQASYGGDLATQVRPPVTVVTGPDALQRAIFSEADWLWLLAAGARPEERALERLLEGVEPVGAPPAAIVAGMLVSPAGHPLEHQLPAPRYADDEAVIRLVPQRLLPIRHATFANCLIRRECFIRHGVPDFASFGSQAPAAWTSAVLREAPGYFAPLSVAYAPHAPRPLLRRGWLREARTTIRMARSGTWTRGECVRALARLVRAPSARLAGRHPHTS